MNFLPSHLLTKTKIEEWFNTSSLTIVKKDCSYLSDYIHEVVKLKFYLKIIGKCTGKTKDILSLLKLLEDVKNLSDELHKCLGFHRVKQTDSIDSIKEREVNGIALIFIYYVLIRKIDDIMVSSLNLRELNIPNFLNLKCKLILDYYLRFFRAQHYNAIRKLYDLVWKECFYDEVKYLTPEVLDTLVYLNITPLIPEYKAKLLFNQKE